MIKKQAKMHIIFWSFVILIILSFGIKNDEEPRFFERSLSYITYPILCCYRIVLSQFRYIQAKSIARKELEILVNEYREKHEQVTAQLVAAQAVLGCLQDIQEIVDFKKRYFTEYAVCAQVLMRHFSNSEQSFILDAGAQRGVTVDMVVVYKNCLIGRVVKVYPFYSKVMLITDALAKIPAVCVKTGSQGIYEGMGQDNEAAVSYISHLNSVETGDMIITSGDGLIYPKGFGLGYITDCALDDEGFNYKIRVKPLLDIRHISYCYILEKGAEYKISDEGMSQNKEVICVGEVNDMPAAPELVTHPAVIE